MKTRRDYVIRVANKGFLLNKKKLLFSGTDKSGYDLDESSWRKAVGFKTLTEARDFAAALSLSDVYSRHKGKEEGLMERLT